MPIGEALQEPQPEPQLRFEKGRVTPGYYWIKRNYCCLDWEIGFLNSFGVWQTTGSAASLYSHNDKRRREGSPYDFVTEIGARIER